MNWNAIRSILDWIALGMTGLSGALLALGCSEATGKITCDSANVPTQFVPTLVFLAMIATFGRTIIKGLTSASGIFGNEKKIIAFLIVGALVLRALVA